MKAHRKMWRRDKMGSVSLFLPPTQYAPGPVQLLPVIPPSRTSGGRPSPGKPGLPLLFLALTICSSSALSCGHRCLCFTLPPCPHPHPHPTLPFAIEGAATWKGLPGSWLG